MKYCKHCCSEIQSKSGKIFCSKSCSAIFNNKRRGVRTKETKHKIALSAKANYVSGKNRGVPPIQKYYDGLHTKIYGPLICKVCDKLFWGTNPRKKCCSKECRDTICSANNVRKRQIPYFNHYEQTIVLLQSSWEETIARWLDVNKLRWSRPTKRIRWFDCCLRKSRTYLPDFYLIDYDVFLDVKNPIKQIQDQDKINQLTQQIRLLVGDINTIQSKVACLAGLEPACVH